MKVKPLSRKGIKADDVEKQIREIEANTAVQFRFHKNPNAKKYTLQLGTYFDGGGGVSNGLLWVSVVNDGNLFGIFMYLEGFKSACEVVK